MAAILLLGACAGTPVTDSLSSGDVPAGLPERAEVEATPFYPQTEYYCGPATMAALLNATGIETSPEELGTQLFTPGRKGTLQSDVVGAARRHARLAVRIDGMADALIEVSNGQPVLLLQNLGLEIAPKWHYANLIGYDLDTSVAILRSGTERRRKMALATLEHTWRRAGFWGVVVVPPHGPVPGTVGVDDWLREAAGVERAGHREAAETAYRVAARHWPDSAEPWIALGNLHYASGDLDASDAALRKALDRAPENDAVLNNLAHVLMEKGELKAAETMASKAVDLNGPHSEAARRTLADIRSREL